MYLIGCRIAHGVVLKRSDDVGKLSQGKADSHSFQPLRQARPLLNKKQASLLHAQCHIRSCRKGLTCLRTKDDAVLCSSAPIRKRRTHTLTAQVALPALSEGYTPTKPELLQQLIHLPAPPWPVGLHDADAIFRHGRVSDALGTIGLVKKCPQSPRTIRVAKRNANDWAAHLRENVCVHA